MGAGSGGEWDSNGMELAGIAGEQWEPSDGAQRAVVMQARSERAH